MTTPNTLFQLRTDVHGVFDGSTTGVAILRADSASPTDEGGVSLKEGVIVLGHHRDLDDLQSFAIEASIKPEIVGGERRMLAEAERPGIALAMDERGKIVGSVHTKAGWTEIDSGGTALSPGQSVRVRFARDEGGMLELRVDGQVVGSRTVREPLEASGENGFAIGASHDGGGSFVGDVMDLSIRDGLVSEGFVDERVRLARRIEEAFTQASGLTRVHVELLPDASRARLQPIKDLINAAGVEKLSDLDTLQLTARAVVVPGTILIARRKSSSRPDWSSVAGQFDAADDQTRRELLATHLPNRNSGTVLTNLLASSAISEGAPGVTERNRTGVSHGVIPGISGSAASEVRLPLELLRDNPTLRLAREPVRLSDALIIEESGVRVAHPDLLEVLEGAQPEAWPVTSEGTVRLLTLRTIPVRSAVIIAGTLDLTDTELVIEPEVTTLYIIAERIVCNPSARISWRRPGGETPARADNPDLNGRGWSGVQTKPDSRDGLDGENARAGLAGIEGAIGRDAPNLEVWVKDLSAVPNFDLSGEDGRRGGRGQRGGRGGDGADGEVGERVWFFGWHCTSDPGDGGDGGDGGGGGRGGRGGNGSDGGSLTVGVLENTLESSVTSGAFHLRNEGGRPGRGGEGGPGGSAGRGGRSGAGETCHDANDGHVGGQGQPGAVGSDGVNPGIDGEIEFFEFSEEAWDDLLTRPWLSEIVPTQVFPGDRLTLRGSRFSPNDRVIIGSTTMVPTINADESVSVDVPLLADGGEKVLFIRRQDGTESNRLSVWIKPQLDPLSAALAPGTTITLRGRAFLAGAAVLVDGAATPANVIGATRLTFDMPGTGGTGSVGGNLDVAVRNPDGLVSNSRMAPIPRILEIPFAFGVHNLVFPNFDDGIPDWGTYEDTFGAGEVWHELLDPIFGHPVLTAAFFGFYDYFLKGEGNGGLATGFCTSLASLVADHLWQGLTDAHTIQKADVHRPLTAVHGKLLSRESLVHFHDQGREGIARVERTYREIESTFLRGCSRDNAPLLFFIPSGAIWDGGYVDRLGDSHCVMPYRFLYPIGAPAPALSADGSTTLTDPDQVELFVWDCNHPNSANCKLVFRRSGADLEFEYLDDSSTPKFRSSDGITLGMMTNGQYLLADHDLPFSGPLGLTRFVIDFLLSPAELQVTDAAGLRTGTFGGQILAEIPDSHPFYLARGAYMLPENTAVTRRLVGTDTGTYAFNSIHPNGTSFSLADVPTASGQEDVLAVAADASQIRFAPAVNKTFSFTISRQVGEQVRAVAIQGTGGGPGAEVDITAAPDLSLIRVGNRGSARTMDVRGFVIDRTGNSPTNRQVVGVRVEPDHDIAVAVADWAALDLSVHTLSFE